MNAEARTYGLKTFRWLVVGIPSGVPGTANTTSLYLKWLDEAREERCMCVTAPCDAVPFALRTASLEPSP